MKKLGLGTIIGISSLILVPLLASAASLSSGASEKPSRERPIPSQECVQALVAKEDLVLADMDASMAARKAAMQARRDGLSAAAAVTDDAQRQVAVQKAHEDFRTAMKDLMQSKSAEMQAAMEAVRTACGGPGGGKGGHGFERGFGGGFGGGRMMGGFHGMRGRYQGVQKSSATSEN